jgi:radical SAM/Cys-rich protein
MSKKSLKALAHDLSDSMIQLKVLNRPTADGSEFPQFKEKVANLGFTPFKPVSVDILQVNVGKMCNQVCKHCHVDAGPDRKEIMTKDTMQQILAAVRGAKIKTIDLTGGAPEMNPNFRWFAEELTALGCHIIVRCNLTIILANPKYNDLPQFFKKHKIEVASSLPHFSAKRTDAQRGDGVFEKSIEALQMLNAVGYGKGNPDLVLNLVFNPSGAFLPPDQAGLEKDFKTKLKTEYDIEFDQLFAITNIPISRFLDYLVSTGNYESYMQKLINAFNPATVGEVMCRNTVSIGWDGYLFDCDFNQMLDLKVAAKGQHISEFNLKELEQRNIILNQHCYGCTAGAGSSCGGEIAQ